MGQARALLVLLLVPNGIAAQQATGDSVVYALLPSSRLEVRTGKSGLLGFAGHEHLIRANGFSGRIVFFPARPTASHLSISVLADSLEVLTPPDTEEIRKVTASMREDVLDVAHFPEITFSARGVDRSGDTLHLQATLTMKGRTRELPLAVQAVIGNDTLHASATFSVKQTDFGIKPYRGGPGGTVRVADRVIFEIEAVAVRRQ